MSQKNNWNFSSIFLHCMVLCMAQQSICICIEWTLYESFYIYYVNNWVLLHAAARHNRIVAKWAINSICKKRLCQWIVLGISSFLGHFHQCFLRRHFSAGLNEEINIFTTPQFTYKAFYSESHGMILTKEQPSTRQQAKQIDSDWNMLNI